MSAEPADWPVLPRQRSAQDMAAWSPADVDDSEDDESPDPRIGALGQDVTP